MAHKIFRWAEQTVYNTPHLITQNQFDFIDEYLSKRHSNDFVFDWKDNQRNKTDDDYDDVPELFGKVGVLEIKGALTAKPVYTACGKVGTSYTDLTSDMQYLIDKGAKIVVLDVDSGGGAAYSCFSSANEVRRMADKAGVKIISMIDGTSCSAAYAWSAIADEVIAHPDAQVGSIGCLIALINDTKALEQDGYERKYIAYPKDKVPLDDNGNFTTKFLTRLEKGVKELGEQFFSHISSYTGISEEELLALDGQVFSAKEALDIGLINKIMTQAEFSDYISNKVKELPNA